MELAMQIISNDKTVRSKTVESLKDFTSQSSSTQYKREEHLVPLMRSVGKALDLMGDDMQNSLERTNFWK